MDDSPQRPKWWLIVTAATLAILTLYYYTGSVIIVVLFFAAFGVLVGYQTTRAKKLASHVCVRCGAKLNPNARQCDSCGSASWTVRN
jgi:ribosomal protein L40E